MNSCISCDRLWEDHEVLYETEPERRAAGKKTGPEFKPLSMNSNIQSMAFDPAIRAKAKERTKKQGELMKEPPKFEGMEMLEKFRMQNLEKLEQNGAAGPGPMNSKGRTITGPTYAALTSGDDHFEESKYDLVGQRGGNSDVFRPPQPLQNKKTVSHSTHAPPKTGTQPISTAVRPGNSKTNGGAGFKSIEGVKTSIASSKQSESLSGNSMNSGSNGASKVKKIESTHKGPNKSPDFYY